MPRQPEGDVEEAETPRRRRRADSPDPSSSSGLASSSGAPPAALTPPGECSNDSSQLAAVLAMCPRPSAKRQRGGDGAEPPSPSLAGTPASPTAVPSSPFAAFSIGGAQAAGAAAAAAAGRAELLLALPSSAEQQHVAPAAHDGSSQAAPLSKDGQAQFWLQPAEAATAAEGQAATERHAQRSVPDVKPQPARPPLPPAIAAAVALKLEQQQQQPGQGAVPVVGATQAPVSQRAAGSAPPSRASSLTDAEMLLALSAGPEAAAGRAADQRSAAPAQQQQQLALHSSPVPLAATAAAAAAAAEHDAAERAAVAAAAAALLPPPPPRISTARGMPALLVSRGAAAAEAGACGTPRAATTPRGGGTPRGGRTPRGSGTPRGGGGTPKGGRRAAQSPRAAAALAASAGGARPPLPPAPKTAAYIGVRKRPWGSYAAEIRNPHTGAREWLGTFDTAEEAAVVYDIRKRQIKGAASKCNFPPLDMSGPLVVREICPKGQGGTDRMPVYLPENWPQQLMKLQPGLALTGLTAGGGAATVPAAAATSSGGSSGSSEAGSGSGSGTAAAARAAARGGPAGGALPRGALSLQRGAGALGPCPAGPLFAAAEAAAAATAGTAADALAAASSAVSSAGGGGGGTASLFSPAAVAAPMDAVPATTPPAGTCALPIPALRLPSLPAPVAPPVLTVQPICTGPPAGTPPPALSPLSLAALAGSAGGTPRSFPSLPSLGLPPLLATHDPSDWHAAGSLGSTPTGAGLLTPTSALAAAMAAAGLGSSAPRAAAPIHAPPLPLHLGPGAPPGGPASPASAAAAARSSSSDDVVPMDRSSPDTSPSRLGGGSEAEAEARGRPQAPAPAGLSWVHAAV